MIDKLSAAESMFKEMQLRMGDPDVAVRGAESADVHVGPGPVADGPGPAAPCHVPNPPSHLPVHYYLNSRLIRLSFRRWPRQRRTWKA